MKNKKVKFILFLPIFLGFLNPKIGIGQTDPILAKIFYNLTLDSSRGVICKEIRADKRFSERIDFYDSGKYHYNWNDFNHTYYGKVLIKTPADSIDISVSWGISSGTICSDCDIPYKDTTINLTYVKLYFYYDSLDSLKKAYNNFLLFLSSEKIEYTEGATITINDKETGEGCYVNLKRKDALVHLQIFKMNLLKKKYSLEIEFQRPGD